MLLQAHVPTIPEHRIANIFYPLATPAANEKHIAMFVLGITAGIFVVVAGLIVFTIWKFRRRHDDDTHQEPAQVYGSNQIEVAWTVIPILIVFVLIGVTARVIAAVQNQSPPKNMVKVRIVGHQWWWEIEYPDYGIVTANELHVPVSKDGQNAAYLRLESQDVIHSFWVPQLSGKTDLIPNRINYMWIDPSEAGVYLGNCAEYCGTQHANMLLRVTAQPREEFEKWAKAEQQTPPSAIPAPTEANAAPLQPVGQGRATFESLSCVSCHNIKGTAAQGKFGPDLTHLMSRQTIGAGVTTNTTAHLRAWVNDPQTIKPGCLMPSLKLTNNQLNQVMTYLQSLN
jgi:cytochrome c oxidase subunit 2